MQIPTSPRPNKLSLRPSISPSPQSMSMLSRLVRFFKSHPLLFLLLLTPGIPEYLSASSQLTLLVISPILFFGLLAANFGLYGSGVILIREAMIRWKKGWASVFLLGVAYGIVEEGIALWTLFNPLAQPVGNLGFYGHWLGVNWVWTVGLLIFHSVYSIGLPIFLFRPSLPRIKIEEPSLWGRINVQHFRSYNRLLCPIRSRVCYLSELYSRRGIVAFLRTRHNDPNNHGPKTSGKFPEN